MAAACLSLLIRGLESWSPKRSMHDTKVLYHSGGKIFKILIFLQVALQKRTDFIAGEVFERKFAHRVVAAGEHAHLVVPPAAPGALDDVARKPYRERRIVARINE